MYDTPYKNKLNKTFARRIGKSLTMTDKYSLENILPKYLYNREKLIGCGKKIYLEIGFGAGEHFIHQVQTNPQNLYIGAEVYLNGVAKVLTRIRETSGEKELNVMIWPDDIDLILTDLPNDSLEGVYILFPDPWHKRKYLPRRLVNSERLNKIKDKLTNGAFVFFASDIDDYFKLAHDLFNNDPQFSFKTENFSTPHDHYIQTKYHQKADLEGRKSQFITAIYHDTK